MLDADHNDCKILLTTFYNQLSQVFGYSGTIFNRPPGGSLLLRRLQIGLGIMGFADTLILLGIRYDNDEAVEFAGKLASFIQKHAHKASEKLAKKKRQLSKLERQYLGHKTSQAYEKCYMYHNRSHKEYFNNLRWLQRWNRACFQHYN